MRKVEMSDKRIKVRIKGKYFKIQKKKVICMQTKAHVRFLC